MAPTNIPGLDVIQAAAASQGIDISDAVAKAEQIMATDPAAMRAGSAQLRTVASGLGTVAQGVHRTGSDLLAGWTGSTATAFAPKHADLVSRIGTHQDKTSGLADQVDAAATGFEGGQQVVLTATGIAAAAIGTQQVSG
jgi:uncharacterized protein YukE